MKEKNYNGKEIFEMLYDNEINDSECIEVIHPDEVNHFIFRNENNQFDRFDLINCLLFKEYQFKIVDQKNAEKKILDIERKNRISNLKKELEELEKEV